MAVVAPCITAFEPHEYREQMDRVAGFAQRLHIDFMDGTFAPTTSPNLIQAWWPDTVAADLHLMYQRPLDHVETIISLAPSLVIVHVEADGVREVLPLLRSVGIQTGLSLLRETSPEAAAGLLELADHVLIFSGDLGHFGGTADMSLLDKVNVLKQMKPELEVGWDGGVNAGNARQLIAGGVDVLNAGGFIQRADSPEKAYATLKEIAGQSET